nr:MAG TPA: hypothetical protein [Caudoviricetes sp.]
MYFHETVVCSCIMNIHFYRVWYNISNQINYFPFLIL